MAVPVIESFEKNSGTSINTLTCNKPTGVASGDLLVLIAANDEVFNPSFSDNKTGWNFIFNNGSFSAACSSGVFWRIADGTEGSSETVISSDHTDWVMFYVRISGTVSSPIHKQAGAESTGDSSTHGVGGVTTTINDCLVLYGLAFDGGDGFTFSVSGTGWAQKDEKQSGTAGSVSSGCWGARDLATSGASGTATVTPSVSDGAAWFQIALEPGGAADTSDAEAPHLFPFMPPQFLQHEIVGY